ncbi:hypothetical protein LX36DRAFT_363224 [Colletotrichum falcatum]|nr:hypothetical protein LX36DRAFT_363224 [Colletotrichum falcatum]
MASSSTSIPPASAGMIDDTFGPVDDFDKGRMQAELAEISKSKIHRNEGHHWAMHHLKMLVSDQDEDEDEDDDDDDEGDDEKNLPYDPDDPEDMERFAIELSLQEESDAPPRRPKPRTPSDGGFHCEVASCPSCSVFPRFSKKNKTRRFRLVEPWDCPEMGREFDVCNHFVAISWCWAAFGNTQTCQIRDCTGRRKHMPRPTASAKGKGKDESVYLTVEGGRIPPDEILDRAVEYAAHEGLRCIWIDRSCLLQDKSRMHQIGIQSMDLVYQKAARTAAILETAITRQATLDSLGMIFAWTETGNTFGEDPGQDWWDLHVFPSDIMAGGEAPWGLLDQHVPKQAQEHLGKRACDNVLDLLEALGEDRWYTRAWILQESISAGPNLTLLFRVSPGLGYVTSPFVRQNGRLLTNKTRDQQTFVMSYTELLSLAQGVGHMIRKSFSEEEPYTGPVGTPVFFKSRDRDGELVNKAMRVLNPDTLRRQHPHKKRGGVFRYDEHFTCNAASAITLLRSRHCFKAEDKVAIVANLCNYEIRLNTFRLAERFKSLRLCLVALALLNGDLSILIPEHYDLDVPTPSLRGIPLLEFAVTSLHRLNTIEIEPSSSARFQSTNTQILRPGGAMLAAYIWRVDRQVYFGPIRPKWGDSWWKMKSLTYRVTQAPGDSTEDLADRSRFCHDKLNRPGMEEESRIREQLRRLEESNGGATYRDDGFPGVVFYMTSSSTVKRTGEVGDELGRMVRDILSYLCYSGEKGLATSIWQSLRVAQTSGKSTAGHGLAPLPDEVDDAFFAHPVIRDEPGAALQIDATRDGNMAQQWLFDRILMQGKLWVGRYISSNTAGHGLLQFQPLATISNDFEGHKRVYADAPPPFKSSRHSPKDHTLEVVRDLLQQRGMFVFNNAKAGDWTRQLLEPWATEPLSLERSNIISRDVVKSFLAQYLIIQMRSPEAFGRYQDASRASREAAMGWSSGVGAMLHYIDTYVGWDIERQDDRCAARVSAFDVDGPCLVATPFDASRERLPHTEERGMSAGWVVERRGMEVDDAEAQWIRAEFVRLRRLALGGAVRDPYEEIPEFELRHVPEDVVDGMTALKLKVLAAVKGTWEVIDPVPFQSYVFI